MKALCVYIFAPKPPSHLREGFWKRFWWKFFRLRGCPLLQVFCVDFVAEQSLILDLWEMRAKRGLRSYTFMFPEFHMKIVCICLNVHHIGRRIPEWFLVHGHSTMSSDFLQQQQQLRLCDCLFLQVSCAHFMSEESSVVNLWQIRANSELGKLWRAVFAWNFYVSF